jgi:hypothetical protein
MAETCRRGIFLNRKSCRCKTSDVYVPNEKAFAPIYKTVIWESDARRAGELSVSKGDHPMRSSKESSPHPLGRPIFRFRNPELTGAPLRTNLSSYLKSGPMVMVVKKKKNRHGKVGGRKA